MEKYRLSFLDLHTIFCVLVEDEVENTKFTKIGMDENDWYNFQIESITLVQKDGLLECGILCATKESCGGLIYNEDSGSCAFHSKEKLSVN